MSIELRKSLLVFSGVSVFGVVVLMFFLPLMPGGALAALFGLFLQLVFVMLGVVTTILMGSVFPPPLIFEVVLALGFVAVVVFVLGVRFSALKLSYTAIVLWVFVGCWSTYWGIVYGI